MQRPISHPVPGTGWHQPEHPARQRAQPI